MGIGKGEGWGGEKVPILQNKSDTFLTGKTKNLNTIKASKNVNLVQRERYEEVARGKVIELIKDILLQSYKPLYKDFPLADCPSTLPGFAKIIEL